MRSALPERRRSIAVRRQLKALLPLVVLWSLGTLALVAALHDDQIPAQAMLLDPSTIADLPWYAGLISNLGVLAWTVAAVSAAGGAFVCSIGSRDASCRFLTHSSLLGCLLALDDMFRLHSDLVPQLFGVPTLGVMLFYMILMVSWFVGHLREIRRTRNLLLYAAGVALVISGLCDGLALGGMNALVFEDAPKFLGALAWAAYFVLTSMDITRSVLSSSSSQA